jgi:salicylate biosynthesis isochorismate synthase/menaquinone-specific isochorismate synthase
VLAEPDVLASARADLDERAKEARLRAERLGRPVLASVSVEVDPKLDVAACVFASRHAEERYFVWEQPERDGFALGAVGSAWTVEGISDSNRFRGAAAACAEVARDGVVDSHLAGPPAAGPVWVGGFAFAPHGGVDPQWSSLPPSLLVLPVLSIARQGERAVATVNVVCRAEDGTQAARAAWARLEALGSASIPLTDPDPNEGFEIVSVLPPESYVEAVARAKAMIRGGGLEKVVLAREVRVEARSPFRLAAVFDDLRSAFPSCFCFCVGTGEGGLVGASPELLVRRQGARVASVALAGSTRRSADPAVDDHLGQRLLQSAKDRGEHEIVARRIERALAPISVWVAAAAEPDLIKVANIQHLATPVRAQLAEPLSAVELAGILHPTPGVGGEPWEVARDVMSLERMDRGWYAGPVGWMDTAEDGDFCVALRCALVRGSVAHCYAGVGVVADSDPEAELEETEVKLQALLPVLAGP